MESAVDNEPTGACAILRDWPASLADLAADPQRAVSPDSCLGALIDSLSELLVRTDDAFARRAFAGLCSSARAHADVLLAGALLDVVLRSPARAAAWIEEARVAADPCLLDLLLSATSTPGHTLGSRRVGIDDVLDALDRVTLDDTTTRAQREAAWRLRRIVLQYATDVALR